MIPIDGREVSSRRARASLLLALWLVAGCSGDAMSADASRVDGSIAADSAIPMEPDSSRPDAGSELQRTPFVMLTNADFQFGRALAIDESGTRLAVGGNATVAVFRRAALNLALEGSGTIAGPVEAPEFGRSVAFAGSGDSTTLFVGAPVALPRGEVHVFRESGGVFTPAGLLNSDTDPPTQNPWSRFGTSLAALTLFDGSPAVVVGDVDYGAESVGAFQAFTTSGTGWVRLRGVLLETPSGGADRSIGESLSSTRVSTPGPVHFAVATRLVSSRLGYSVGIYGYVETPDVGYPLAELTHITGVDVPSPSAGAAIALDGSGRILLIADPQAEGGGEVSVWRRDDLESDFVAAGTVAPPEGCRLFGRALALRADGEEVFVGASCGPNEGAVIRALVP